MNRRVTKKVLRVLTLLVAGFGASGICAAAEDVPRFVHPGVFLGDQQLASIRTRLAAQEQNAMDMLRRLEASRLAQLDWQAKPRAVVECGSYSKPDNGCTDETNDARAAYAHALLWMIKGDERHARKAVEIMDAWSGTLAGGHTLANAPLQAAWAAELWPRAAELIRYSYPAWSVERVDRFGTMLRTQYLPNIRAMGKCHVFNWQASAIEARMNMAVFLDDRPLFDEAVAMWPERAQASIYLEKDGAMPRSHSQCPKQGEALIKDWFGQRVFRSGHAQETCRDLAHTAYGIAALANAAETAYIQGVNLYGLEQERMMGVMEYHAMLKNNDSISSNVCGGTLIGDLHGTMHVGYHHYVHRLGLSLPQTERWRSTRTWSEGYFHYSWEVLTHGTP